MHSRWHDPRCVLTLVSKNTIATTPSAASCCNITSLIDRQHFRQPTYLDPIQRLLAPNGRRDWLRMGFPKSRNRRTAWEPIAYRDCEIEKCSAPSTSGRPPGSAGEAARVRQFQQYASGFETPQYQHCCRKLVILTLGRDKAPLRGPRPHKASGSAGGYLLETSA